MCKELQIRDRGDDDGISKERVWVFFLFVNRDFRLPVTLLGLVYPDRFKKGQMTRIKFG